MLRKLAAKGAEDRLLLTILSTSMPSNNPIDNDAQYPNSSLTDDQVQLLHDSELSLENNVILAHNIIPSTNLQHTALDLVPILYVDTILSGARDSTSTRCALGTSSRALRMLTESGDVIRYVFLQSAGLSAFVLVDGGSCGPVFLCRGF